MCYVLGIQGLKMKSTRRIKFENVIIVSAGTASGVILTTGICWASLVVSFFDALSACHKQESGFFKAYADSYIKHFNNAINLFCVDIYQEIINRTQQRLTKAVVAQNKTK